MSVAIDWDLVSDRISGEVRRLRLTQAAVGKLIGISQSSVSSYQKGTSRKRPSIDIRSQVRPGAAGHLLSELLSCDGRHSRPLTTRQRGAILGGEEERRT